MNALDIAGALTIIYIGGSVVLHRLDRCLKDLAEMLAAQTGTGSANAELARTAITPGWLTWLGVLSHAVWATALLLVVLNTSGVVLLSLVVLLFLLAVRGTLVLSKITPGPPHRLCIRLALRQAHRYVRSGHAAGHPTRAWMGEHVASRLEEMLSAPST